MSIDATTNRAVPAPPADDTPSDEPAQLKRGPLSRLQRRVLGVLVEKAKTTPDYYPMSVSALITGSNQKSNRSPQMELDEGDVLLTLDELRELHVVTEVQGSGRVNKYRHSIYEWLGINGRESAVMAELLLRGAQTIGEIRTRASRMETLADLATAQEVVDDLVQKGYVIPLGRPGRGQQYVHTLYEPAEREKLARTESTETTNRSPRSSAAQPTSSQVEALQQQINQLQQRIEKLESHLAVSGSQP